MGFFFTRKERSSFITRKYDCDTHVNWFSTASGNTVAPLLAMKYVTPLTKAIHSFALDDYNLCIFVVIFN
jgi:hypothetical protein